MCKSAICGGVISMTKMKRDMKKYGVWANMMCFVLDDKHYKRYVKYQHAGKEKQAKKIFDRWATSLI